MHLTVQGDLQILMIDMPLIYRYMRILVNLNIHPSLLWRYCSSISSPTSYEGELDVGNGKESGGTYQVATQGEIVACLSYNEGIFICLSKEW